MPTLIPSAGLARIGNVTSGGGLAAAFDANATTTAYAQGPVGTAGLDLRGQPKRIHSVRVTSAYNGFDASGLTSAITLQLYARNGAAPATSSDGVLLGSVSFTDINAVTTRTVTSFETATAWDWVWIRATTGAWTVFAEVEFFEADDIQVPTAYPHRRVICAKSCNDLFPLTWAMTEVPQFRILANYGRARCGRDILSGERDTSRRVHGASRCRRRCFGIYYRTAATMPALSAQPWLLVPNATTGCNIINRDPHHYGSGSIVATMPTLAGLYEFSVRGSAHATESNSNGLAAVLAEGGSGLNHLRVSFDKDAVMA